MSGFTQSDGHSSSSGDESVEIEFGMVSSNKPSLGERALAWKSLGNMRRWGETFLLLQECIKRVMTRVWWRCGVGGEGERSLGWQTARREGSGAVSGGFGFELTGRCGVGH